MTRLGRAVKFRGYSAVIKMPLNIFYKLISDLYCV